METSIEDLVRLAWQADRDGRDSVRDALLTLAAAGSVAGDAVLAERTRKVLAILRPGHWFASSATISTALAHPKVAEALAKLRLMYPPVRVRRLMTRDAVLRGPYTGRTVALANVLADLSGEPAKPPVKPIALPFPVRPDAVAADDSLVALYAAALFALAVLLETVIREQSPTSRDSRAA